MKPPFITVTISQVSWLSNGRVCGGLDHQVKSPRHCGARSEERASSQQGPQKGNTMQRMVNPVDLNHLIKGEAYLFWGQEMDETDYPCPPGGRCLLGRHLLSGSISVNEHLSKSKGPLPFHVSSCQFRMPLGVF